MYKEVHPTLVLSRMLELESCEIKQAFWELQLRWSVLMDTESFSRAPTAKFCRCFRH